jgi:hypothetical protein
VRAVGDAGTQRVGVGRGIRLAAEDADDHRGVVRVVVVAAEIADPIRAVVVAGTRGGDRRVVDRERAEERGATAVQEALARGVRVGSGDRRFRVAGLLVQLEGQGRHAVRHPEAERVVERETSVAWRGVLDHHGGVVAVGPALADRRVQRREQGEQCAGEHDQREDDAEHDDDAELRG